jgi:hypothetical protein
MTYETKLKLHGVTQIVILAAAFIAIGMVLPRNLFQKREVTPQPEPTPSQTELILAHQLDVWLYALEWCESRGLPNAINPMDRDGTQSWGAFQFKPQTFAFYRQKYGLPSADLMDYAAQRETVLRMIQDPDVRLEKEFPECIKKIGMPPKI